MKLSLDSLNLLLQRQSKSSLKAIARSLERMSSGHRLSFIDNPAEAARSSRLTATIRSLDQAARNIDQGINYLDEVGGVLQGQLSIIQRMRELALTSANGTLSEANRSSLQDEFEGLMSEFYALQNNSTFFQRATFSKEALNAKIQVGTKKNETIDLGLQTYLPSSRFTTEENDPTLKFSLAQTLTTGAGTFSTSATDINNDGFADLLLSSSLNSTMQIYLANGNGTFAFSQTLTVGSTNTRNIRDLDGDGDYDMVTISQVNNTANTWLNNGSGVFTAAQSIATGTSPGNLTFADFDGDGDSDFLVTNRDSDTIHIFLSNGDGTFNRSQTISGSGINFDTVNFPHLSVADFNNDGRSDFVVSHNDVAASGASVWLANGSGTFSLGQTLAGGAASYLTTFDFNNDGIKDISVVSGASGYFRNYTANGNGTFAFKEQFTHGISYWNAGDANGDAYSDYVVGYQNQYLYTSNGNGTFSQTLLGNTGADPLTGVSFTDIDADGDKDIILRTGKGFSVYRRNSNGSYTNTSMIQSATNNISEYEASDRNGDGYTDILFRDDNPGSQLVYLYLGNASATYSLSQTFTASQTGDFISADWDGDGDTDLINSTGTSTFTVRSESSAGTYSTVQSKTMTYPTSSAAYVQFLSSADWNGDGFYDLIAGMRITDRTDSVVHIYLQDTTTYEVDITPSIATEDDAGEALDLLDQAQSDILEFMAAVAAKRSRLDSAKQSNQLLKESHAEAQSHLSDTDMAEEVTTYLQLSMIQESIIRLMAQNNLQLKLVLELMKIK